VDFKTHGATIKKSTFLCLYVYTYICVCVYEIYVYIRGTAVAQWLRYCATNQKVAGSIPDGAMEFFIDTNPSDRTTALRSTQPLTEMSTGSISWG
jgi:hypothetical protein